MQNRYLSVKAAPYLSITFVNRDKKSQFEWSRIHLRGIALTDSEQVPWGCIPVVAETWFIHVGYLQHRVIDFSTNVLCDFYIIRLQNFKHIRVFIIYTTINAANDAQLRSASIRFTQSLGRQVTNHALVTDAISWPMRYTKGGWVGGIYRFDCSQLKLTNSHFQFDVSHSNVTLSEFGREVLQCVAATSATNTI